MLYESRGGYNHLHSILSLARFVIGWHEVLLPINHKNYNFVEKKNSQVMKEWENLY